MYDTGSGGRALWVKVVSVNIHSAIPYMVLYCVLSLDMSIKVSRLGRVSVGRFYRSRRVEEGRLQMESRIL